MQAPAASGMPGTREVCAEQPVCRGFADTNPSDPVLGADPGAGAADALFCAGVVKGHAERCPANRDSRTQEFLCPDFVRGLGFPGQQVMCGACLSSRAEMLAFGIKALVRDEVLAPLAKCAGEGRCEGWRACGEAGAPGMRAVDWTADYFGWALTTDHALVAGGTDTDAPLACRPHDAATWTDALEFLAALSGLSPELARDAMIDVRVDAAAISAQLRRGCRIRGVEAGDPPWLAAAIAFNNAGISCMPGGAAGRTANICETSAIEDCLPTRYVMATLVARMRGDLDLAECAWIDVAAQECPAS